MSNDNVYANFQIDVAVNHTLEVNEELVRQLIGQILTDHEFRSAEISVAIIDDPTIKELNANYLNHDYETDVLSFVLEEDSSNRSLVGEIIVSADTAIRVAAEENVNVEDELLLYVIHGMLHVIGLDDKDPIGRQKMRDAELLYTRSFGLAYCQPQEPDSNSKAS